MIVGVVAVIVSVVVIIVAVWLKVLARKRAVGGGAWSERVEKPGETSRKTMAMILMIVMIVVRIQFDSR